MSNRSLGFVSLLVVAAAGTAHAQAPGDQPLVLVAAPAVAPASNVMARRWAVSVGLSDVSLAPSGGDSTSFGSAKLAVRYRATPHLELEVSFAGGSANNSQTYQEDLSLLSMTAGLRYRMRPGHKWDWYPLVDLGAASITDKSDSDAPTATRARLDLGVGVERRFGNLGLSAELRLVTLAAIGSKNNDEMSTAVVDPNASAPALSTDRETGGELALGATYYF